MPESKKDTSKNQSSVQCTIKIGNNKDVIELSMRNSFDIEERIDEILFYKDTLAKISKLSSIRLKYLELFVATPEKVFFNFNEKEIKVWEKIGIVLFSRYPFPTKRDYIYNHGISSSHLITYLDRHNDFFLIFDDTRITLSKSGLNHVLKILDELNAVDINDNNIQNSGNNE